MAADDAKATFSFDLDAHSVAQESNAAASELEKLRSRIHGGNDAVKQLSSALRSLKGDTEEVKDAKEQLRAKLDAEKAALSAANLAILKQGTTYEKLAATMKATKAANDNLKNGLQVSTSESHSLTEQLGGLTSALGGVATVAGVAVAALAGAALAGATALGLLVIKTADANRNLQLSREAFAGSAENAARLGSQVDLLASKVAAPKEEINQLGNELLKTRLGGAAIVDTMNAVEQASGAMGKEVGNQVKGIITRGQMFNRFRLNPLELPPQIQFKDVAAQLAKTLHVTNKEAERALFEGRVTLDDGAKAMRATLEKNFGAINARKMLSLDELGKTAGKTLQNLAKGVDIEPMLNGFGELIGMLDTGTVAGDALKGIFTDLGGGIVSSFKEAMPTAKTFIKDLIIGGLDIEIAFLKVRKSFRDIFGQDAGGKVLSAPIHAATEALHLMSAALDTAVKGARWLADAVNSIKGVPSSEELARGAGDLAKARAGGQTTSGPGFNAPKFSAAGQTTTGPGFGAASAAGLDAGKTVVEAANAEGGVVKRPAPGEAFASVAPGEQIVPAGGAPPGMAGGGGRPSVVVNLGGLVIHVGGAGGGGAPQGDVGKQLADAGFLAKLTAAIETAVQGVGVPPQTTEAA